MVRISRLTLLWLVALWFSAGVAWGWAIWGGRA